VLYSVLFGHPERNKSWLLNTVHFFLSLVRCSRSRCSHDQLCRFRALQGSIRSCVLWSRPPVLSSLSRLHFCLCLSGVSSKSRGSFALVFVEECSPSPVGQAPQGQVVLVLSYRLRHFPATVLSMPASRVCSLCLAHLLHVPLTHSSAPMYFTMSTRWTHPALTNTRGLP
jgi:hypothetical protein